MPTSTAIYPFDPTGSKASNLITREQQVLSPPIAHSDYHLLIPKLAPFFSDGLIVKHQDSGRVLQEGVDYELTHHHRRASWAIMKPVYGSVLFLDRTLRGVIEFTYQTLGGEWTVDGAKITSVLSSKLVEPRITTWEQIVTDSIPCEFPPIDHQWNLHDMVGMTEVKQAIDDLASMLFTHLEPFSTVLAHLDDKSNPHEVNKVQVKLGNVENHPISSKSQAENGTHHSSYMTPLRTRQAFDKFIEVHETMLASLRADLESELQHNRDDYNAKFAALRSDMNDEDARVEAIARSLVSTEESERKARDSYLLSLINNNKADADAEIKRLDDRIDNLKALIAGDLDDYYTKPEIHTILETLDMGRLS